MEDKWIESFLMGKKVGKNRTLNNTFLEGETRMNSLDLQNSFYSRFGPFDKSVMGLSNSSDGLFSEIFYSKKPTLRSSMNGLLQKISQTQNNFFKQNKQNYNDLEKIEDIITQHDAVRKTIKNF